MSKLFRRLIELFGSLFSLAFPMFAGGRAGGGVHESAGRWVARFNVVGIVLLLLWLVNQSETIGLKDWIPYGRIGEFWLPLFAFFVYAMIWLGWWLYRVLSLEIEPAGSEFPDIDRAWSQALDALAKAEIPLDNTPLFLVLGWSSGEDGSLLQASGLKMQVKQVPRDPNEPLHVTANREGIWVTCAGASVMGQHNPATDDAGADWGQTSLGADLGGGGGGGGDAHRTIGVGREPTLGIQDFLQNQMKALEQRRQGTPRRIADPEPHKARLRHLCRLIARDRHGLCPVNGILVELPITAADPGATIQEIAGSCRTDLAIAHEIFRIRCPVLVIVCDLQKLDGFDTLIERLPSGQVNKRMGQRFPLATELNPAQVAEHVQGALEWVGESLFPSMVTSLFQVESPGGEDLADVMRANAQLFQFMDAMRKRHERLPQLVKDCIPALPDEPMLFGGCYFCGNGDSPTAQAFTPGVLSRMVQDQDLVTWTESYLEEDSASLRLAHFCKIMFSVFIGLGIVLAIVMVVMLVLAGEATIPTGS
jgi:hypothetical protein